MLINVKKSGQWAFGGIHVVYLEKGEQDMKPDRAQELIDAGRAELVEKKAVAKEPDINEMVKESIDLTKDVDIDAPTVESVEKKKLGWWHVKFEVREDVVKVRGADNEDEAVTLALAELEVE